MGAAFTIAIGPIAAVVLVGVVTSTVLTVLDEHYGITDKVIAGLDELGDDANSYIKSTKENIERRVANATSEVFDYMVESAIRMAINTANHSIQKFLSPRPRVFK